MYLSIVLGLATAAFVYLGGHTIVKETVVDTYDRFRSLNKLVSSRHKNCFMIMFVSIQLVFKALWITFLQWANNSVQKVDRYHYEIAYVINGRYYKMLVKPKRGPGLISLVVDENQDDVTSLVKPYIGVTRDFHGHSFTPQFFGKKELHFELSNGESKTFGETDVLVLE